MLQSSQSEIVLTGIGETENTRTKNSIHKIENGQKEINLEYYVIPRIHEPISRAI